MHSTRYHILISTILLLASTSSFGQRNCGTVEYMNKLENVETKEVFENWILKKLLESPSSGQKSFNVEEVTIYQIPLVVHIIHNGESIGTGSNISESQIQSQLDVLNEDFRKLNGDSINIPAEFISLFSDIGFEFVLAKRNPDNETTNGITRTLGTQSTWGMSNNTDLKSLSYWPSADYLNMWIAPLSGGLLGWAQYPETNLLEGLEPPYDATTDGVVITYNAFGSSTKDPSANLQSRFDLGRTATHEIGHFFGLRHIWGDGGCSVDDYVTDTPLAEDNYFSCPTVGASSTSCGSQDMFMNYMDYVDDDCMNIFSTGQKNRMVVVIENSPRRLSLTTSMALIPPDCEDLAIIKFTSPDAGICDDQLSATVEIKNVGLCMANTSNISLYLNNTQIANQDFELNLDVNQTIELTFNSITLTEFGNFEIKVKIETVNGNTDVFEDNNTLTTTSLRAESVVNLFEDFSSINPQWTIRTNQEVSSLDKSQSVFYSITNTAAVFNYYKNENVSDAYISPKLTIGSTTKTLLFDYAYGYRSTFEDVFTILASTDCGNTFNDTLFIASGETLATTTSSIAFYPSAAEDWNHIQIDLSKYVNQEVIFSFTAESAGGNRILFDNIQVVDDSYNDIALVGLTTPSTLCVGQVEVTFKVENKGTIPLTNLDLQTQMGAVTSTVNYSQLNLLPGERISLLIPVQVSISSEITVSLLNPDDNASNDNFTQTIIPFTSEHNIPLREKFNGSELPTEWTLTGKGTDQNQGWTLANDRLELIAENSPAKGLKEMIVLPLLNLENLQAASMHFDFAYAFDGFNEELLRVKVSNNCTESYETLFSEGGEELATSFTTTPWLPTNESDWKNIYIDLSEYAGNENVQIVIEITSAQGNNAFVKNIELFASNIINPVQLVENTITAYPNPCTNGTINISFNLEKSQPAKLVIYNSVGAFILEKDINTALNQTFEVTTQHLRNGMYFVRLVGDEIDISRSFMVNQ